MSGEVRHLRLGGSLNDFPGCTIAVAIVVAALLIGTAIEHAGDAIAAKLQPVAVATPAPTPEARP